MAYTTTTNYGLKKGSGGSGQTIEQQRVYDNENADTIDATMKAISDAADAAQADADTAQASADTAQGEVDALENIVSTKANKAQEDITNPTFVNSWANYNTAVFESAGYWKDGFGIVHLMGIVSGGANNTVCFTLPINYRPAKLTYYNAYASGGTSPYIVLGSDGTVTLRYIGTLTFFVLSNIAFRAA